MPAQQTQENNSKKTRTQQKVKENSSKILLMIKKFQSKQQNIYSSNTQKHQGHNQTSLELRAINYR